MNEEQPTTYEAGVILTVRVEADNIDQARDLIARKSVPNRTSTSNGSCKMSTRTEVFARSIVLFESGRAQRLAGNISAAIHKERQAELMLRQALVPEGLGRMLEPLLQEWGRSHHISPLQCEGWRCLVKP